jgi:hypothetical protein
MNLVKKYTNSRKKKIGKRMKERMAGSEKLLKFHRK